VYRVQSVTQRAAILVVEDERIVAIDVQHTLNDLGYDAFAVAGSAQEAIAIATTRKPDLVLMDVRIKGSIDGITAAATLREKFGVAVVFLTAHADESTLARARSSGPCGYVVKPVRASELHAAVAAALHQKAV
jgi:CheY-like chemotaxis protein